MKDKGKRDRSELSIARCSLFILTVQGAFMTPYESVDTHDTAAIEKLSAARQKIMEQLSRVIVGQQPGIEELLISLFSRGHCLLEGVPGLAKTPMISTL